MSDRNTQKVVSQLMSLDALTVSFLHNMHCLLYASVYILLIIKKTHLWKKPQQFLKKITENDWIKLWTTVKTQHLYRCCRLSAWTDADDVFSLQHNPINAGFLLYPPDQQFATSTTPGRPSRHYKSRHVTLRLSLFPSVTLSSTCPSVTMMTWEPRCKMCPFSASVVKLSSVTRPSTS